MKLKIIPLFILMFIFQYSHYGQTIEKSINFSTGKWNNVNKALIFKYNRIVLLIEGYDGWNIQTFNSDLIHEKEIINISRSNFESQNLIENVEISKSIDEHLIIAFKLKQDTTISLNSFQISNSKAIIYNLENNTFFYQNTDEIRLKSIETTLESHIKNNEIFYKKRNENEFKHLCYETGAESIKTQPYFLSQDIETGYLLFPKGLEYIDFCQTIINPSVYEQALIKFKLWKSKPSLSIKIPNFTPTQSYHCFSGDKINIQTSSCCINSSSNNEFKIDLINNKSPNIPATTLLRFSGNIDKTFTLAIPCNIPSGHYSLRISTNLNNEIVKSELSNIFINNTLTYTANIPHTFISPNDSVLIEIKDFNGKHLKWLNERGEEISIEPRLFLACPGSFLLKLEGENNCDSLIKFTLKNSNSKYSYVKESASKLTEKIENHKPILNRINKTIKGKLNDAINNPTPLLLIHIAIIFVTSIVFWKRIYFNKSSEKESQEINFNPIFYSIELATPFLDLNCSKHFLPKNESSIDKFRWTIYRALIIWGWFFTALISSSLIKFLILKYNNVFIN